MAIENVMVQTNQVVTYAVCCTMEMSLEAINRFLQEVQQMERDEDSIPTMTVVHAIDAFYSGPTTELRGDSPLRSPFVGVDYKRIEEVLEQIVESTGSRLKTQWFLVLDQESDETSSAVIVNIEDDGVQSVRVAYPPSSRYLSAATVASPHLGEMIEIAGDQGDGILRD